MIILSEIIISKFKNQNVLCNLNNIETNIIFFFKILIDFNNEILK